MAVTNIPQEIVSQVMARRRAEEEKEKKYTLTYAKLFRWAEAGGWQVQGLPWHLTNPCLKMKCKKRPAGGGAEAVR